MPEFGYFCQQIVNIYDKCKEKTGGEVLLTVAYIRMFDIPIKWQYLTYLQVTRNHKYLFVFVLIQVASYIPQLARYDPNYWGVSICTVSGQRFSVGDVNVPFTLQVNMQRK